MDKHKVKNLRENDSKKQVHVGRNVLGIWCKQKIFKENLSRGNYLKVA